MIMMMMSRDQPTLLLTSDSTKNTCTSPPNLDKTAQIMPIVQHILVSQHDLPNAFGAKLPVKTALNIDAWYTRLTDYHDRQIVDFLRYGWPINYTADILPDSSLSNHPSALTFSDHVDHFFATELDHGALAGPFTSTVSLLATPNCTQERFF